MKAIMAGGRVSTERSCGKRWVLAHSPFPAATGDGERIDGRPMTEEQPTLPAVWSLLQTEPLLEVVADAYGIEGAVRATLLRSWTNDVYHIEAKAQQYILKVYRRGWRSPKEVGWEVELQRYLAARAIAAPVIPRRNSGLFGTVQVPEGVRALALFGYAPGVKPEPPLTPTLYHSFGRGGGRTPSGGRGLHQPVLALCD
jgi:Ser/Thr protein kinase RdoA (MazF antagonist)